MKRKFIITEVASYTVEAETIGKAEELFRKVDDVNRFPCDVSGRLFRKVDDVNRFPCDVSGRETEAPDPNLVKVGDQVNVDAHYGHDEDFSGVVVHNDGMINGRIKVKAPDGEVYDCDANCVYVPGGTDEVEEEVIPTVDGGYPKTMAGMKKLVTRQDGSLHRIALQRDELLDFARMVAAGNSEFETLEAAARELLARS